MKQHTAAVEAEIQGIPALASKVAVGHLPKTPAGKLVAPPFVVIYPTDGIDTAERLAGPSLSQHPRFILHIVGSSADNVATVTALVKARFIVGGFGVVLNIPGETCGGLWWSSPMPLQVDDALEPPLPYQVVEIGFTSDPA